jgi:hypothetical protein
MSQLPSLDQEHVTLCEVLDRILNKGAVVVGEVRISVANIDLIYLGLQLVLTSIESARDIGQAPAVIRAAPSLNSSPNPHDLGGLVPKSP